MATKQSDLTLIQQAWTNQPDTTTMRLRRLERGRQYLRGGNLVYPSGQYQALPEGLVNEEGVLSLTASSVHAVGNIAPLVVNGGFAYTSTDTKIHWYWDGTNGSSLIVIRRADGTKFPVPSGDIEITGLSASQKYYFLPYWNTHGNSCTVSWVVGTAGSPMIAFTANTDLDAIQQQSLQGREQLWGGWMDATTTAPASPPGGGGGGGRSCVMHGATDVEPLVVEGAYNELLPETNWVRLTLQNGTSLNCTHDHPVYTEQGRKKAIDCVVGDSMITKWGFMPLMAKDVFVRQCLKERWHVPGGHAMWCNGFLCHNMKAQDL